MGRCIVSIIICTHNRADSLRQTLASIGQCSVPADLSAELIVVDNGSTDSTRQLVEQTQLPNLSVRYVFEKQRGKSHALNRGLAEARGDIFLFTDDDVRVSADWIEGMCRPIQRDEADLVAGGVVLPATHEQKLAVEPFRTWRTWYAGGDRAACRAPDRVIDAPLLAAQNTVIGANLAFSRRVLSAVSGFDTRLGPGALGFYEESLFAWQVLAAGFRLVTRQSVTVEHHFELARITYRGLLDMAARMSACEGYLAWHWFHREPVPVSELRQNPRVLRLIARLLLRPWGCVAARGRALEMRYVQKAAYNQQLWEESRQEPRYSRRAPQPKA